MDNNNSKVPNQFPEVEPSGAARIAIVAEAPGRDEAYFGTPFVGQSGELLNHALGQIGIARNQCFVGNVAQVRPGEDNDFNRFDWEGTEVQEGIGALRADLERFKPTMVLCLGNAALHLFKHGRQAPPKKREKGKLVFDWPCKIGDWRGSLFESNFLSGVAIPNDSVAQAALGQGNTGKQPPLKCLATFHPAALAREPELQGYWRPLPGVGIGDLERLRLEAGTRELVWPRREIRIARSVNQIAGQLSGFRATKLLTAQDIEGGAGNITSIAFSQAPGYAYVIPLARIDGTSVWSEDDEVAIWELVEAFNADPGVPKALHNASFDLFAQLWTYGICPQGPVWDTMEGMWEIFPELAKGLDTAVSLLTRWPYYKPDKESDEEGGRRLVFESDEQFWTYNGMDAANTVEVWQAIWRLLRPGQREHWRFNSELCYPKMKAICTGLKVDLERVEEEKARAKRAAMELQARIDLEAAMSPAQVGSLLFDLYHGALDNEQAFAKLCLAQLCGSNPREKRQVVEERWQPMKGGGTAKKPKWVKARKLLTTQDCNSAYGSEWTGVEETPVLVSELCFVAKHRTVEKLFPVEPATLADLEPHILDSKQVEWKRVKPIWKELAKGSEGAQALLGELSLLLSLGINTGSNSEDGDSQWFLFETCGLPKVFKDERKGRYSKEAEQAWKARVKNGPKKRASKRKGNQANAETRDASTVSSPLGKKPSTDQNALDLLYASTQDERALWVLQQRRLKKVVSDLSVKLDPDGRLRFNLTLVKETGRMSASANKQLGTGNNPMALNKDLRRVVVAEDGYEMGQIDLEGADSWTVAAELAVLGDRAMMLDLEAGIKPAQILCLIYLGMIEPEEQDRAKVKALVKETKSGWPDWLYLASKSCLHGSSYGMGWQTMKSTVLKYSMADLPVELGEAKPIVLTKAQIDTLQGGVFARYPKLKRWHEVEGANLLSKGWTETSGGHRRLFYGRKREVKHGHWVPNHDTLKEVLATKPQFYTTFTVKRVWHKHWHDHENRREDGSLRVEILLLVHDSIGPVRWRVEDREFAARKLRQWFEEVVLEIAGQRVRIPADGTMGRDWSQKQKCGCGESLSFALGHEMVSCRKCGAVWKM